MMTYSTGSLSSRRAWIEIPYECNNIIEVSGRSPHGERGLKCEHDEKKTSLLESLSSRRAWIEIMYRMYDKKAEQKMSLSSRRAWIEIILAH